MSDHKSRNPYLDARREWNERYGDYIQQARQWRMVALVCSLVAAIATGGIVWIGSQSKLVPYLVYVDHSGNAVVGHEAETTEVNDNMVRALFAGFIEDWRSVSVDAGSEKRAIDHVYAHLSRSDPAFNEVSAYYKADNPFDRAKRESVTVAIASILRTSPTTLEAEWSEERTDRKGFVTGHSVWKASASTALSPPTKEADILRNPTGFFVQDLQWSEKVPLPKP
jgi:type IV secretory pathway TrbF-like protein